MAAINQLADEKGLPHEVIMATIEDAVAAAYRKDYGRTSWKVEAKFNPETGETAVWRVWDVVEPNPETDELDEPDAQVLLSEARKKEAKIKIGDKIREPLPHQDEFGRIAAQTAKQVVIQRLKEAERDIVFTEYKAKEGQLINGVVQQIEGGNVIVDLGRTTGLMPPAEQVTGERYYPTQRIKLYVKQVEQGTRGPRILLSRTDPNLISQLFALEVPEIVSGTVEIKDVAREPGHRTKIAVTSKLEGLDPVGSCVGQRGTRVQAVLAEIGEEKIDIILFDEDPIQYIKNSLSPAKVREVKLKKKHHRAEIEVPDDQLSLAIGRGGQNVRLASKLTGWEIDILKKDRVPKAPETTKMPETSGTSESESPTKHASSESSEAAPAADRASLASPADK
jgi:N utilization substance protein A